MDLVSVEALDGLKSVIQSLLPVPADANLQPSIHIQPTAISPIGLGGFVGLNVDPPGEILGRRIEGSALINLKAATASDLDTTVSGALASLLAADRATLLNHGLLHLSLRKTGEIVVTNGAPLQQQLTISVLYEFLKFPTESEDVIQEIPLNIQLQP